MKKLFGLFVAVSLTLGAGNVLMAEEPAPAAAVETVVDATQTPAAVTEPAAPVDEAAKPAKKDLETIDTAGVIEVIPADAAKKEKYNTILLKVGEVTYKLLPGKDKKAFGQLESLAGKTVKVKGSVMPANPPKYPMAAIKVEEFSE